MRDLSIRLRLAWRNLWRHPRRTALSLGALSLGAAALIVVCALRDGLLDELRTEATLLTGEAQAHAPGFLLDRSLQATLAPGLVATLRSTARAQGLDAAPRQRGDGLLVHADRSAPVSVLGIEPEAERALGRLPERLASGAFLAQGAGAGAAPIVLGERLARLVDARLGDELTLVAERADGSMGSALVQVAGVLGPLTERLDSSLVLLEGARFAELFRTLGAHEIAFSSHGARSPSALVRELAGAAPGAELRTWQELLPDVAAIEDLWRASTSLLEAIFFLAAGLGVLNAMLMSWHARIPELGVLRALGTSRATLAGDVLREALLLALVAAALGGALGAAASLGLQHLGWDLSGGQRLSLGGVGLRAVWRARLSASALGWPLLLTTLTALAGALWPALKAARLSPVEAMRHV